MSERSVLVLACEEDRTHTENPREVVRGVLDIVSRARSLLRQKGSVSGRLAVEFTEDTYDLVLYGDPRDDGPDGSISGDPAVQNLRAQGQRAR